MDRSRQGPWMGVVLGVLGLAWLGVAASDAGAQGDPSPLQEPPAGWQSGWRDMWGPGWLAKDAWRPGPIDRDLRWRLTRHWTFIREGVPPAYRGARNPLAQTPEDLHAGAELYAERCASCHDPAGMGGGEAGFALHPSPALLSHLLRMPQGVDEYLMWAIADGGEPFGTAMPTFKTTLTETEIWQIITFMRAGFPAGDDHGGE
jgi:mono/diheme cytochrome c family protein